MSKTTSNVMDDHGSLYWIGHFASGSAILATLAGFFPPLAALVAAIFYCVQLYESETVKNFMARRRAHKIARLRAKVKILEQYLHEQEEEK